MATLEAVTLNNRKGGQLGPWAVGERAEDTHHLVSLRTHIFRSRHAAEAFCAALAILGGRRYPSEAEIAWRLERFITREIDAGRGDRTAKARADDWLLAYKSRHRQGGRRMYQIDETTIARWERTLAEEWHNGARLEDLTDSQRRDIRLEAEAIAEEERQL